MTCALSFCHSPPRPPPAKGHNCPKPPLGVCDPCAKQNARRPPRPTGGQTAAVWRLLFLLINISFISRLSPLLALSLRHSITICRLIVHEPASTILLLHGFSRRGSPRNFGFIWGRLVSAARGHRYTLLLHLLARMADEKDKREKIAPSRSEPTSDVSAVGEAPAVSNKTSKGKDRTCNAIYILYGTPT